MKIELVPCNDTDESIRLAEHAFMLLLKEQTLNDMFKFININGRQHLVKVDPVEAFAKGHAVNGHSRIS